MTKDKQIIEKQDEIIDYLGSKLNGLTGIDKDSLFKANQLSRELAQLKAEAEKEVSDEIIDLVDRYWKFDEHQQHLSSWHDKQDCLAEMRRQIENHYSKGEVYKRIGGITEAHRDNLIKKG